MRGPRQTALFWINDTWGEDGAPVTASSLALADQNPALIVGLGVAARDILQRPEQQIEQKLLLQSDGLRPWAAENGIAVYGGKDAKSAIVSLDMGEKALEAVTNAFDKGCIVGKIVSVQTAELLQLKAADPKKMLRLSAHVYTTESELEQLKQVFLRSLHQSGRS